MISLLVPITSRGCPAELSEQPLVKALVPSLRAVECFGCETLIGYDSDDPIWSRRHNRKSVDFPGIKWIKLVKLQRNITGIWNNLAARACGDYLMPLNDDLTFETSPLPAIDTLAARGNFGTVTFHDDSAPDMAGFFVTHRTHLEIFGGIFYPLPWNGAHQDSWISDVYRPWNASEVDARVRCSNHIGVASRFEYGGLDQYPAEVMRGRHTVNEWLKTHPVASPLPDETLASTRRIV